METFKLKGTVRLRCTDKNGKLLWDTGFLENLIVNTGKAEIIRLIGQGLAGTRFRYMAVGTSNSSPAVTQTALQAEITDSGLARVEATVQQSTTTITGDTLEMDASWTATADKTVEEVGIFNATSGGIMLGRRVTGSKIVPTDALLQAEYKVIIS